MWTFINGRNRKRIHLNENELKELFVLGLNYDVGYEYIEKGVNHEK